MRRILSLIVFLTIGNTAYASKTVSGVVAVSTGPMQAYTQSIGRDLAAGDDVFLNDEVETGETTRAQVLLRDESVFSLAPSSKVLFDAFVYDPMAGEGVLEASLLSGGMRFVSGQLSKNQPENIKIKAGKATVGIRGTEIMAKHSDAGTTFVLLSGAMEIATESGRQIVERSGFGIDISNDGMLGAVRQVPLAEINAILAPPPKKEESKSADGEATSEESGEESAEADEESEDTASDTESEASETEAETESQETAASETEAAQNDNTSDNSASEDDSSFDAALTSSLSSSEGEAELTVAGLSDVAAPTAVSAELPQAEAVETPTVDIVGDVLDAVVSSLAEDTQKEQAEEIILQITQPNISLKLNTAAGLTNNPFYSSSANLLVRSSLGFKDFPDGKFDVTHALLREKFPDSFDANGIINHVTPQSGNDTLSSYDAIFVYFDADEVSDESFSSPEEVDYHSFIHSDGKKVLMIGDQRANISTINSALGIYNENAPTGFEYSIAALTEPMPRDLNSVGGTSELLKGVTSFEQYYDSDYESFTFNLGGVGTSANFQDTVTNGLLTSSNSDVAALDMGDSGAVFFGRWTCAANSSMNGFLGASILPNSVNNDREQFCRNLISSIAPDTTLVDVEVGSLSVLGDTTTASYRLISSSGDAANFSIIGDKLILRGGADLTETQYDLVIGVTPPGGNEIEETLTLNVADGIAEKRHISTRNTYHVNEAVSFSTENLVTDTNYLVHATKNADDVSWVSIGSVSGGGNPTNTGIITLHYRVNENNNTYDRFHEIEIVHDCQSDHCEAFATSMDTANELTAQYDFDADDKSSWRTFFDRFTTGIVNLQKTHSFTSTSNYGSATGYQDTLNADYDHNLAVNFALETAVLNTEGTFDGIVNNNNPADFDVTWSFNMLDDNGPCAIGDECILNVSAADSGSIWHNLETGTVGTATAHVALMNMALPNGKRSLLVRSYLAATHSGGCTNNLCHQHITEYEPMTPQ